MQQSWSCKAAQTQGGTKLGRLQKPDGPLRHRVRLLRPPKGDTPLVRHTGALDERLNFVSVPEGLGIRMTVLQVAKLVEGLGDFGTR